MPAPLAVQDQIAAALQGNRPPRKSDEIIRLVSDFFSTKNIDQKSRLTERNIHGIIVGRATNQYLENKYRRYAKLHNIPPSQFRNRVLDEVIKQKLVLTISRQGGGRKDLVDIIKSIGAATYDEETGGISNRIRGR